jgi:cobaltochelatase CobS
MGIEHDITNAVLEDLEREMKKTVGGIIKKEPEKPEDMFLKIEEPEEILEGIKYSVLYAEYGGKEYIKKSKKPDFIVTSYYNISDWDIDEQELIPDEEEVKYYQPDHDVLYPATLGISRNKKVLVYGPTGSGKTEMYKFIAALIHQPYMRINGRQDMESDSLLGKPWVSGGDMHFALGELPIGLQKGRLICFDEPWKTPSGIQMALQRYYERDGVLFLDDMPGSIHDKTIVPENRARMVLCDNVIGTGDNMDQFGATLIQDSSTLNRMDMVLKLDYLPKTAEIKMMMHRFDFLPKTKASKMVQIANLIRTGYIGGDFGVTISPRNLITWAELAFDLKDYNEAFKWTMLERYSEDDERAAIRNHWITVWGEDL